MEWTPPDVIYYRYRILNCAGGDTGGPEGGTDMAQATLNRVLEDIRTLELEELGSVERAVQERMETAGYSHEEWKAMQALMDAGLMKAIKPRCKEHSVEYKPVPIQGKPLSETVIEERR